MQPIIKDNRGIKVFKANRIVDHLACAVNWNELATIFPYDEFKEDWQQFAQLSGYSVRGFAELPYVTKNLADLAQCKAENPDVEPVYLQIECLEDQLNDLRAAIRNLVKNSGFSLEELGF
jgi:hypothetical protein